VDDLLLGLVEGDHRLDGADLVVDVDPVGEAEVVRILVGDTEEVTVEEVRIGCDEVAAETGELLLHETFDTSVLDDVDVVLDHTGIDIVTLCDLVDGVDVGRSVERVTHLVGDEHVVELTGHLSPLGKDQLAALGVERCSTRGLAVLDVDVFGGKDTSESVLGINVDDVVVAVAHTYILPQPEPDARGCIDIMGKKTKKIPP